jgi:hypothetical protein
LLVLSKLVLRFEIYQRSLKTVPKFGNGDGNWSKMKLLLMVKNGNYWSKMKDLLYLIIKVYQGISIELKTVFLTTNWTPTSVISVPNEVISKMNVGNRKQSCKYCAALDEYISSECPYINIVEEHKCYNCKNKIGHNATERMGCPAFLDCYQKLCTR